MTDYALIRTLLDTQLATVPGLPKLTTENKRYETSSTTAFARSTLMTARPQELTLGTTGKDLHRGSYRVDLFYPLSTGTTADAMANAVVAAFPRQTPLTSGDTSVRIVMAWKMTGGKSTDNFYHVPIDIEFQTVS